MEKLNTNLVFNARRGSITASVSSTSYEIGVISNYTFSIELSNPINNDSLLIIYFPTVFSSSFSATYCNPTCSISSSSATFTSLTSQSLTIVLVDVDNPL